jgi:hypothetical protein
MPMGRHQEAQGVTQSAAAGVGGQAFPDPWLVRL